ncbi:MAG: hypothetical protein EXX96DRAFT_577041 [Benjaminiella poitrasii]|nr:MAG: hypothetical protein EXX96DRAFT_577041 [Benjaminiella poitrasii]
MDISSSSIIPTVTTPLLSNVSNDIKNKVHRVPTFIKSSIPNRRSILKAFFNMTLHMLFELVLPIILYYVLRKFVSPLTALLLTGLPTAIIVVFNGIRYRKVDMLGVLMLLGFAVSGVLAFIESDPKLYLLRESAMTLAMGIMLFLTLIPLHWPLFPLKRTAEQHVLRPFMFYVGRQIAISCLSFIISTNMICEHWDWFWNWYGNFRCFFRVLTAIWSVGLVSEFLVRIILIRTLKDVDYVVYYSNIYMLIVIITLGILSLFSALLFRHQFNLKQRHLKLSERRAEIDSIIARAAAEQRES